MNRLTLLILAVSVAAAAPAVQAEPKTREQVRLELEQAKNAGLVTYGEQDYPPAIAPVRPGKTRAQVADELQRAKAAGLVTYGEQDYPPPQPSATSRTRAEVRADLVLWKRAGMEDLYRGSQTPDVFSLKYRQRYAEYVRMRTGAEYQQQLDIENGRR